MALRQILSRRQQVTNARGQPLAAGQVFLYEPNTTTKIAAYGDSGLTTQISNPVKLSGSGRAEVWVSRDCDVRIEDRNGNLVVEELNANPDQLGVEETGGLVPNGSFENDADADDVPDGWTLTSETGSNNGIDDTESTDGGQCFRFTSTGAGGGTLETTNFFPVNDTTDLRVNFDLRSTDAGVRNIVRVRWFDVSEVFISNSDIYDSTANPTSFTSNNLLATPPANARFAKLTIIGCDASDTTPGSTFVDRVEVFYPALVEGVFDNITVQNNEIVSTNTNGPVQIKPDGTGLVELWHDGDIRVETAADGLVVKGDLDNDPTAGGNQDARVRLVNQSDAAAASLGFATGAALVLENTVHGGAVQLAGEDAAGTLRVALDFAPDGNLALAAPNGVVAIDSVAVGGGQTIADSNNVALYDESMASFSVGTLPDARLSSNVALYDESMASFSVGTLPDARLSSNVSLYDGSMASFTAGTLSDARLSSNVALLDAGNVFTTTQSVAAGNPEIRLVENDAAADEDTWSLLSAGSQFIVGLRNSDGTFGERALDITRAGSNVGIVNFESGELQYGGNEVAVLDGANDGDFFVSAPGAAADEKHWGIRNVNGTLTIAADQDDLSPGNTAISAQRVGTAVDNIILRGDDIFLPNIGTTGSAANAFLDSGNLNQLLRSTSARRYKRDIVDLSRGALDRLLELRPVEYRSLADADDPDRVFYGLIAEEVAEIDRRLVVEDVDGEPDGVMYDRIGVGALALAQDLHADVDALRGELAALRAELLG